MLTLLREQSFDNCPVPAHGVAAQVIAAGDWPAHLAGVPGHPLADWSVPGDASRVFVSAGDQPSQGYRIALWPPVQRIDGVLRVQVRLVAPPPGAFVAMALSSPCLYLLVQGQGDQLRVDFGDADLPAL
ncbi:MAG: protease complex subunit PrcB family protein [Burkholderiaceae bacterium]